MPGRIFLLKEHNALEAMIEQPYESEKLLQVLLACYPDLLAGEQMNPEDPRRWLLVSREYAVAYESDGPGVWSLDHLFLDQEGIPTLVETKRGANREIRRKVVGQMLDYAANAIAYWPVEAMRAKFELGCEKVGEDPDERISSLLQIEDDADLRRQIEIFWDKVKTNLQAGRIRIVFVSDVIPTELERIVEFLNQQMDPAEVLAVEIRQFVSTSTGQKSLVPRVIGQIARKKPPSPTPPTREEFYKQLEASAGNEAVCLARKLIAWIEEHFTSLEVCGRKMVRLLPSLEQHGLAYKPIAIRSNGLLAIRLGPLSNKPPFDREMARLELQRRCNEISEVSLSTSNVDGIPTFKLMVLRDDHSFAEFTSVLQWFNDEVGKFHSQRNEH